MAEAARLGTTIEAIPRGDLYLHLRMAWRGIESALVCLFADLKPYSELPASLRGQSERQHAAVTARLARIARRGE